MLALLLLLPGRRGKPAAHALAQLLDGPYMRQAPSILIRWADTAAGGLGHLTPWINLWTLVGLWRPQTLTGSLAAKAGG